MKRSLARIIIKTVLILLYSKVSFASDPLPKCKFFIPDPEKHIKKVVELTQNTKLSRPLKIIKACSPRYGGTLLSSYLRRYKTYLIYSQIQKVDNICAVASEKIIQKIYRGTITWVKISDDRGIPIRKKLYATSQDGKCPPITSEKYFIASGIPMKTIGVLAKFYQNISSSESSFDKATRLISQKEKATKSWSKFKEVISDKETHLVEMQSDSPGHLQPYWLTLFSSKYRGVVFVRIEAGVVRVEDFTF